MAGALSGAKKAGGKLLDLSKKARLVRAKEQGFTGSGYHGTGADVDEFNDIAWVSESPSLANQYADARGAMGGDPAVMPLMYRDGVTFDADGLPNTVTVGSFANELLTQAKARGVTLNNNEMEELKKLLGDVKRGARAEESGPHYSRQDFWNHPADMFGDDGSRAISDMMDMLGYQNIKMTEQGTPTVGIRNPKNIRSVNAAFDPDKTDSSNILAGLALGGIGTGAAIGAGTAPNRAFANPETGQPYPPAPNPYQPLAPTANEIFNQYGSQDYGSIQGPSDPRSGRVGQVFRTLQDLIDERAAPPLQMMAPDFNALADYYEQGAYRPMSWWDKTKAAFGSL